ncbi:MAG: SsrA-binding protein SmpB [Acidobacteria bacterium]|nr:SsrA-binding protein SmpB [Acidobacteriota bacterium]
MAQLKPTEEKILSSNRQAPHNYHLLERYEAGLALTGTEVKAVRAGSSNLKDSFAIVRGGEAWLLNCHISPYEYGNRQNHDPLRKRKLLLHREEIRRLTGKVEQRGLTLIPIKLYLKNGRIKCEIALAKGKKVYDKRETERRKTADREAQQAIKYRKTV